MSHTTRNSNNGSKSRKNTNNSTQREDSANSPQNRGFSSKNKGFKASKSRNLRPDRSKGMKMHSEIASPRANRDRKSSGNRNTGGNGQWIWGFHAADSALKNNKRVFHKILMTPKSVERLKLDPSRPFKSTKIEIVTPADIDAVLPDGAVHQGVALSCAPLLSHHLDDIAEEAKGLIIVLDQITDPHNVGAMFRLARAFNAKAIIMQSRNAPPLAGAVTKVAVGTVESVPHVFVTNIANTLLALQKMNWRVTGLAGEADLTLQQALTNADAEVIVMGAEGPGLRKRVRDCCDQLAKIPMPGGAESLNVSTAAAIALYEVVRNQ
ncbi:MAG: 23S rRNA (guanosine(2251)-2'-O)-methyltransferase RlmB [Robiginitomaculum sp.]|nr:MAG: 23S rRNA (guanosine(2251)-2'-O)-methyltransferase RlmB [Robiginitomaculum sp.]